MKSTGSTLKKRTMQLMTCQTQDLAGRFITDPYSFDSLRPTVKNELLTMLTEVLFQDGKLLECKRMCEAFDKYIQEHKDTDEQPPAGTSELQELFYDLNALLNNSKGYFPAAA